MNSVATLWRFPVKSMLGERLQSATITPAGVEGDRAYGVIDTETGKVVSAKNPKLWPAMLHCRATTSGGTVTIALPDGGVVRADDPDVDAILSKTFGRSVHLASAAPPGFAIDHELTDIPDADPRGTLGQTVESKLGAALWDEIGSPSAVPAGSFFDMFPMSLVTTSTLETLNGLAPESNFDERRFRMNVTVATDEAGLVENGWLGRTIAIGDDVRLLVTIPDPRCVMTTLPQEDLPKDNGILRALVAHNRLDVGGGARYPCCGVYAVVQRGGTIRPGDRVEVR